MEDKFELYYISSREKVNTISNKLSNASIEFISIKVDYKRDGDTYIDRGKRFVLCKGVESIEQFPYSKVKVYDTENTVNGNNPIIFIVKPTEEILNSIEESMNFYTDEGLLTYEDWVLKIYRDYSEIVFRRNVSKRTRAIIKTLLDSPGKYRVSWKHTNR